MNNNDKPHAANDIYHVPTTFLETESFDVDAVPMSDEVVNQNINDIEREEIRLSFNEITQDLARFASSEIEPPLPSFETTPEVYPHIMDIIQIGDSVKALRKEHVAGLAARMKSLGTLSRIMTALVSSNPSSVGPKVASNEAIEDDLVNRENAVVSMGFPADKEVTNQSFFLHKDIWYMQQASPKPEKNFTNSYAVYPDVVKKSSTYYDQQEGRVKNVLVTAEHAEIITLKTAATRYHNEITKKIYKKTTRPRGRTR